MKTRSLTLAVVAILTVAFTSMAVSAATKKSTIRVDGMTCNKCTASVEKALKATAGVEKVEVSLQKKEVVVEYNDEQTSEAKLREVINATGFKAVEEKTGSQ
jgi:copper chaperone CopZ